MLREVKIKKEKPEVIEEKGTFSLLNNKLFS